MGEWTKGKLKFDDAPGCRSIKGGKSDTHKQAQYKEIACTVGLYDDDEDRANAARLVACWNAHVGDPDPAATMKEVVEVLRNLIDTANEVVGFNTGDPDAAGAFEEFDVARDRARALLAKLGISAVPSSREPGFPQPEGGTSPRN